MKGLQRPIYWLGSYLALLLTPLLLLLLAPIPAKGGFWWEMGIALGFAGLVMLVLQFVLTARFSKATAPFGIDVIYYFHRYLAYALLVVLLGHPVLLLIDNPALLSGLIPWSASWAMLSGMLALLLILLLVATSVWRKQFRIPYNNWRQIHLLLAMLVVVLAFTHMWTIGYYSAAPIVNSLWQLIALSVLLVVLYVRVLRPWHLARKPWVTSVVKPEQGNSWTLTLTPRDHAGLNFQPGQFAWLSLGHSPFSMQEHPFTIASAPGQDGTLQFTIKELGDSTRALGGIRPGTTAYVDGPYGVFSFDRYPEAPGYVFIVGGIGVTPMISMLQGLVARGDQRPHLLFAAHSRWDRIPRRDEIAALARQLNMTTVPVLEEPPPDWTGEKGWITRAMLERYLPADYKDYEYFICGPLPMLRVVERFLHELQVPMVNIHTELFDMA